MTDKTIEELTAAQAKLEADNDASYQQLQTEYGLQMDTTHARLQTLIDALSATVWTEEQRLTFEINFQVRIKEALDRAWEQIREQKAKEKLIKPASQSGKLFGPDGRIIK